MQVYQTTEYKNIFIPYYNFISINYCTICNANSMDFPFLLVLSQQCVSVCMSKSLLLNQVTRNKFIKKREKKKGYKGIR